MPKMQNEENKENKENRRNETPSPLSADETDPGVEEILVACRAQSLKSEALFREELTTEINLFKSALKSELVTIKKEFKEEVARTEKRLMQKFQENINQLKQTPPKSYSVFFQPRRSNDSVDPMNQSLNSASSDSGSSRLCPCVML